MEDTTAVWQISFISLIAGALIGVLVYRLLSPSVKQASKIKADLDQAKGELANYKASVGQHFDKTSELVNDLTQNYVRVYQHLADGAQTLGDSKAFPNLLERHQSTASIAVDDTVETTIDDSRFGYTETEFNFEESMDEHAEAFSTQASDDLEATAENLTDDPIDEPVPVDENHEADSDTKSGTKHGG